MVSLGEPLILVYNAAVMSNHAKKALLFISHGSRAPESREENIRMAAGLKERTGIPVVQYAFLEVDSPDIPEGIRLCREQGAREIIVLLNFLNTGRHISRDIPAILAAAKDKYRDTTFRVMPHVGAHPGISNLFLDLVLQAEKAE